MIWPRRQLLEAPRLTTHVSNLTESSEPKVASMFRKKEPIEWPPEAYKWEWMDAFGDTITPDSYTSIWVRLWRRIKRRGDGSTTG